MAVRKQIKLIIRIALIVGFALNALSTYAQTPDDEVAAAMKQFNEGVALTKVHDKASLNAAIQKFQTAQVVFEKYKIYDAMASAYLTIGLCRQRLGSDAAGLANFEKSLATYETAKNDEGITLALNTLGEFYIKPSGDPARARDYLLRAWDLVQKHPDNTLDLTVLDNLGYSYVLLADYQNATGYLWKEVELAMKRGDEEYVSATQSYGDALVKLEVPGWAPTYYELALRRARQANLKTFEAQILNSFGELYLYNLNERQKAFAYFTDALKVSETVDELHTRTLILNNLAQCHYQNFEFQKALEYYDRAMVTAVKESNLQSQATILSNLGNVYQSLNDYKKADSIYEEARRIAQQIGDRSVQAHAIYGMSIGSELQGDLLKAMSQSNDAINLVKDLQGVRQFLIDVLLSRGNLYLKSGFRDKALEIYTNSLETAKERNYRSSQGKLLNNIGKIHELNGDLKGALKYYNEALIMGRVLGEKYTEARILENMMMVWSKLGNQPLAAFFGKSSVNVYQELRKNISNLSPEHQRSFIGTFEETYRKLSEILIHLGRIAEAEQVLTMLKEEELLGYVRRDDDVAKQMLATMSISDDERASITRYEAIAGDITAIGMKLAELEEERKLSSGEFPKQAEYLKLKQQLGDATLTFQKFLDELKMKFGQNDARVLMVDSSLKTTLNRLKATRTAAVATIVGKDELNIIVTTSKTQRAHTIKVTESEINELVAKFHTSLTSPQYDPRPLGQQLYDLIVKPIEGDLAGIKADTILWSLDGSLRYVPPAAFWDRKNGYMAERFANVMVNLASRDKLALSTKKGQQLSVLGVGVSKPTDGFSALTAVPDELDCIVVDATTGMLSAKPQCTSGVLNGRKLLDDKFTIASFEGELGRYPIVHIASHFKLTPGDDKNSFLLLGGGADRKFTVEKLRSEPLTDIELIVLSACNTATPGGARANGVEVEGFGSIAQKEGAKSVLATLWSVADTSTKDFMVEFYRLYGKEGLSKADAMRRAQLKLMYGKYSAGEAQKNRADDFVQAVDQTLPPFKADPNAPFAHPFYWSPFTLIGNWQ